MVSVRVGTSGWHYAHWVGPFYPPGMRPNLFLRHYFASFDAVEVNNSFYRLPKPATLRAWRDASPPDALFACKASRFLTHMKKLHDPAGSFALFWNTMAELGDKLGPILFQLPPRWRADAGRLDAFLDSAPARHRYAFECRDDSWWSREVLAVLQRHNAAFCLFDLDGRSPPPHVTSDFVYVRLHGPDGPYRGSYSEDALGTWARRLRRWRAVGLDAYCFLDNDEAGYAARNALRLREMATPR